MKCEQEDLFDMCWQGTTLMPKLVKKKNEPNECNKQDNGSYLVVYPSHRLLFMPFSNGVGDYFFGKYGMELQLNYSCNDH